MKRTAQGNGINLAAESLVPASNNQSGAIVTVLVLLLLASVESDHVNLRQLILVSVANLLEDGRGGLRHRRLSVHRREQTQLILHNIGNGLCIGGRTRSAAPDRVMYSRQLVRDSVCNVGSGRCS